MNTRNSRSKCSESIITENVLRPRVERKTNILDMANLQNAAFVAEKASVLRNGAHLYTRDNYNLIMTHFEIKKPHHGEV